MRKVCLIFCAFLLTACSGTIPRWTNRAPENGSRTVPLERKPSVFADFLWAAPDVRSVKVGTRFTYNSREYSFVEKGERLLVTCGAETKGVVLTRSSEVYRDVSTLRTVTVLRQRWVPRTVFVNEMVPVQRTRMVPQTTFDAKGFPMTTMRTEFYTDWEMRYLPRTEWSWEQCRETALQIPESEYYDVSMANGDHFFVYRVAGRAGVEYYVQNPEYLIARQEKDAFFGADDTAMVFIDAQSNGTFFEDDDRAMLHVWNPYDRTSSYRSLDKVVDNYWYTMRYIQSHYFLDFSSSGDSLSISYGNDEYIGSKGVGSLLIENIAYPGARVIINGKAYRCRSGSTYPIQYGKYHLTIQIPKQIERDEYFVINDESPSKVISYEAQETAAVVRIRNVFSGRYRVVVKGGVADRVYFSPSEVYLPQGVFVVCLDVNGYVLERTVDTAVEADVVIDLEKEAESRKKDE